MGEAAVASWYEAGGYRVVSRNWRCREGEIDLVVRGHGQLVFCEVKTRDGTAFGSPFEAVTAFKQRRLRVLATRWLAEHGDGGGPALRFDVAAVRKRRGFAPEIEVIEGAF